MVSNVYVPVGYDNSDEGRRVARFEKAFYSFLLKFSIVFVFIILGFIDVVGNINYYSVYYAKHVFTGKVVEPDLAMFIDNLQYLSLPENDNVRYDFDDMNYIEIQVREKLHNYPSLYGDSKEYIYTDGYGNMFVFDKRFVFSHAYDSKYENIANVDVDKVKKEIREVFSPILEKVERRKPILNLQYIFDWYYHDRFN